MLKSAKTLVSKNSTNALLPKTFIDQYFLYDIDDEENDNGSVSTSGITCSPKPLLYRFHSVNPLGIEEVGNFRSIVKYVYNKPLLILDLDNTVQEPGKGNVRQLLGSDQWFEAYLEREKHRHKDFATALNLTLAVYDYVQIRSTMKAVEAETPSIIKNIQEHKIPILGLTTRGGNLMPATLRQLKSLNIAFEHELFAKEIMMLEDKAKVGSRAGLVTHGIIFCNGRNKGECLKQFLNNVHIKPHKIVFADDKLKNVQQLQTMCDANSIPYLGLHYTYLADKLDVDLAAADAELAKWQSSSPKFTVKPAAKLNVNAAPRLRSKSY